jgi:recombination protein RecA
MRVKAGKEEATPTNGKKKGPGLLKIREAIFGSAEQIQIDAFEFIPTGIPTLDRKLGGGIIIGGVVELLGLEATGKSTLAAMIAAQAQKRDMPVVYLDTEAATSMARLKMLGVDIDSLIYVQPGCLEDVYDTIGQVLLSKVKEKSWEGPALIVWDSLAQTPSKKEIEMEEGDEYTKEMAVRARVNSMGLRKLTLPIQKAQVTLLIVNQVRENVGQTFGEKYSSPGGHAPKFASIQRIKLDATNTVKIDEAAGITGKKVRAKTIKNKAYTPLLETDLIFNHSTGLFDEALTVYEELKSQKRLTTGTTNELNLNQDVTDSSSTGIVKFRRKEWDQVYTANKDKIYAILK